MVPRTKTNEQNSRETNISTSKEDMRELLFLTFYVEITLNLEETYKNQNSVRTPGSLLPEFPPLLSLPICCIICLFSLSLSHFFSLPQKKKKKGLVKKTSV